MRGRKPEGSHAYGPAGGAGRLDTGPRAFRFSDAPRGSRFLRFSRNSTNVERPSEGGRAGG
ncbi:MAG: hypothetical protein BLITH_0744 [Brockia lithotrophica]|uniref:Uncharacterized protein n=1 Tax=Brockia lithotrophica TaxID=933949 RepID=A0A2T5G8Q7_9BACL|nr:MAG: hypothetical protein BLITH_0744 [Brockia lithotrophica]